MDMIERAFHFVVVLKLMRDFLVQPQDIQLTTHVLLHQAIWVAAPYDRAFVRVADHAVVFLPLVVRHDVAGLDLDVVLELVLLQVRVQMHALGVRHHVDGDLLGSVPVQQIPHVEPGLFERPFGPVAEVTAAVLLLLQFDAPVALLLALFTQFQSRGLAALVLTHIAPIAVHNFVIFLAVEHETDFTLTRIHRDVSVFHKE